MEIKRPDYRRIYIDLIIARFPEKLESCISFLEKNLTSLDVIKINSKLFPKQSKNRQLFNQKHKAYDKKTIKDILEYQRKNNLSNIQLSKHFRISRNTIASWKKYNIL